MAEVIRTETDPESGHRIAHYASGVKYDLDAGKLIAGPTDPALNPVIRDPYAMSARRKELHEQDAREAHNEAAEEAIANGKLSLRNAGNNLGWKLLNKKAASLAYDATGGRSFEGTAMFIGRAGGYLAPDEDTPENIAAAIARLFMPFLERLPKPEPERDVIQGKVIE